MKKLMVAMAAAAISVAGFADTWFTAGFGSEAVSTGGSWSTNETGVSSAPTWEDTTLKLTDVEDPVIFAATDKKCTTGATVAFSTEVNFKGFDELPAIDDEAKAGICALNDGNFWVVGYDTVGETNKWVDTGLTATLDADVNVAVTVTNMTAYYQFGDEIPFSVDIKENTFSEVCYTGNGSVTQLGADFTDFYVDIVKPTIDGLVATCAVERAEIGSTVQIYFVDGTKISSNKGAYNYTVEADGNLTLLDGQVLPTALDPGARIGSVLYLTFADAYEAVGEEETITLCSTQSIVTAIEKTILVDLFGNVLKVDEDTEISEAGVFLTDSSDGKAGKFSIAAKLDIADSSSLLSLASVVWEIEGDGYITGTEGSLYVDASYVSANKMLNDGIFGDGDVPEILVIVGENTYEWNGGTRYLIGGEVAYGQVPDEYEESFATVQAAVDAVTEVYLSNVESLAETINFKVTTKIFALNGEDDLANCTRIPPEGNYEVVFDIELGENGGWKVNPTGPVTTYVVSFSTNGVENVVGTTNVAESTELTADHIPAIFDELKGEWDVDPVGAVITCDTNFNFTVEAPVPPTPTYTVTFSTNTVEVSESTLTGVESGSTLADEDIPVFEGGSWDVNPTNAVITCDTNFNYTIEAKVYPSDIPEGSKADFDTWHAKYPTADRATSKEPFLLDCDPANLEEAKAAFKIISITKDGENWIVKVAGDKGEGDKYGNGYVHFVSVKSTKFPTAGANSDFFQAVLDYTPANPPE